MAVVISELTRKSNLLPLYLTEGKDRLAQFEDMYGMVAENSFTYICTKEKIANIKLMTSEQAVKTRVDSIKNDAKSAGVSLDLVG